MSGTDCDLQPRQQLVQPATVVLPSPGVYWTGTLEPRAGCAATELTVRRGTDIARLQKIAIGLPRTMAGQRRGWVKNPRSDLTAPRPRRLESGGSIRQPSLAVTATPRGRDRREQLICPYSIMARIVRNFRPYRVWSDGSSPSTRFPRSARPYWVLHVGVPGADSPRCITSDDVIERECLREEPPTPRCGTSFWREIR